MKLKQPILIAMFLFLAEISLAQEKIVVQTDRDIYINGEPMWLSAVCIQSGSQGISDLSKVAYVEVLNRSNKPVGQFKIFLDEGFGSLRMLLPDTLTTGNYLIRAYTKWMQNYDANLYFSKQITLINPFSRKPFPVAPHPFETDTALFFAESGKAVLGVNNKIFVHSLNEFGLPKSLSGEIISPNGIEVGSVKSNENGIALFDINPTEIGLYTFKYQTEDEGKSIPAFWVNENAAQIKIEKGNNNQIRILIGGKQSGENQKLDIVTADGKLIESFQVPNKQNFKISVNSNNLPKGYICALLVEEKAGILASRYFMAPSNFESTAFNTRLEKQKYSERESVKLNIENLKNLNNISISVVRSELLNQNTAGLFNLQPENIPLNSLQQLSTSEISVNDLLIPFQHKSNFSIREKLLIPENKGEIISGTIVTLADQKPIRDVVFMMSFVGEPAEIDFCKTDSLGGFMFEANRFGEQELVIQPFNRDSFFTDYKVNLDLPFCNRYPITPVPPLFMSEQKMTEINQAIINMQVQASYNQQNNFYGVQQPFPEKTGFYGEASHSIKMDQFIELPTMEEIIREIVPHTHLIKNDDAYYISISDEDIEYSREQNSFCMVDGVPILNQNNLLQMNADRVERIDVENRNVFVKEYQVGKIFNLITSNGNMGGFDFDKRIFRQVFNTYSPSYKFAAPDYSIDTVKQTRIPDFRNVLYWESNLQFDTKGNTSVEFYTGDDNARYTIVLSGVNSAGIIEESRFSFEVSSNL